MSAAPAQAPAPVQNYLRYMLGAQHLERHDVDGGTIRLWFRTDDAYFGSEEVIARIAIGGGFSLLHRFGFAAVQLHASLGGQPVRLHVGKAEFDAFFQMSAAQLDALAKTPDRWDDSPIGRVTPEQQWQFFLEFSKFNE